MSDEFKGINNIENKLNSIKDSVDSGAFQASAATPVKNIETSGKAEWNKGVEKPKKGFIFYLFLVSLFMVILSSSYFLYTVIFSKNSVSADRIEVSSILSPKIESGSSNSIRLNISNTNKVPIFNVGVKYTWSKGLDDEAVISNFSVGDILAGQTLSVEDVVTLTGNKGDKWIGQGQLTYQIEGSSVVFTKSLVIETEIGEPPVTVSFDVKREIVEQTDEAVVIKIRNTSQAKTDPFKININLSPDLVFGEQKITSEVVRTGVFVVPSLGVGDDYDIKFSIIANSSINDNFITIKLLTSDNSEKVVLTKSESIKVQPVPFRLNIGEESFSSDNLISFGEELFLIVNYENKSQVDIKNAEIKVTLSKDAFESRLVRPDSGIYDLSKGEILYNGSTNGELQNIKSGSKGQVRFTVPIVKSASGQPRLLVTVKATGDKNTVKDFSVNTSREFVVQGNISIKANTTYKNGTFENSGPVPPKVDTETTYTINLGVSSVNNSEKAKVYFNLPAYVEWQNKYSYGSNYSFDSKSRTVTLNIGNLTKGSSTLSSFVIKLKPSITHLGKELPLTSTIVVEAQELGSNAKIRQTISPVTTNVASEFGENSSFVVE